MNQRPKCDSSNYKVLGESVGVILRQKFLKWHKKGQTIITKI